MRTENTTAERAALVRERASVLRKVERWLEQPMIALGLAWLVLLIVELTRGLTPFLFHASTAIWVVFIVEFLVRLAIAPVKSLFLRKNWLTIIALAIPALRVFRILHIMRLLRATRGLRLVRVVTSVNRGMSVLGSTLQENKFGYVVGVSLIVTFAAAAGMYAFERPGPFDSYAHALWWTAMMMTTMGSEVWPRTPEGRILALLLAFYAFAVWGYVTATMATFFLGRKSSPASRTDRDAAGATEALRLEIQKLRQELQDLRTRRAGNRDSDEGGDAL